MGTLVNVQEVELKYTITATEDTSVLVTLIGHVHPLVCGQGVLQHVEKVCTMSWNLIFVYYIRSLNATSICTFAPCDNPVFPPGAPLCVEICLSLI